MPENCYPDEGGYAYDVTATFNGKPFDLTDDEQEEAERLFYEVAAENAADERAEAKIRDYEDREYDRDYDICDRYYDGS